MLASVRLSVVNTETESAVAKGASKRRKPTMAQTCDRHELYEAAVQNVAETCTFIDFYYRQIRGRKPKSFREDFCGTGSAACEWVRLRKSNFSIGVDIDPEVLRWGRRHRRKQLSKSRRQRVALLESNVKEVGTPSVDVVGAFNFSYWVFRERRELLEYFRAVHKSLKKDGLFFLDAYGGSKAFGVAREPMEFDGFTYVWQQAGFNPINGQMLTHIHFEFPDGSRLKKAFSYHWRVWSLPEIRELLAEAGFRDSSVYFEFTDEDGNGLGEWYRALDAPAEDAWIANIIGVK